ncbi:hypothetical protein FOWG_04420 [Fusarium oxysporum f. sp. lycopersici MN25]|uniref:Uncharacterized protein n=1 Tax=Fusarium oxysporum Fo47 TaxID=660027 RepID=W9JHD5_FUSOX|nr:hypothetical protein FOZG_14600 [Fusarium oxysporum Fo47]EWZ94038.1 hypothetical protein FOWG_04420 [Fusarium oxysporum f. sp. lycopersici MN25]
MAVYLKRRSEARRRSPELLRYHKAYQCDKPQSAAGMLKRDIITTHA